MDRRAHLCGDDGVHDADGVGAARSTGGGLRQGFAKHVHDGGGDVLGHDHVLADDEAFRQLDPGHEARAVGFLSVE